MNLKNGGIKDKWFYLAIILLGAFFLFKLYDQSQILIQFPLDQNNDIGSYIGQLHFLKVYGFHQNVPNWYNGFTLFLLYPPGWFFFTLPLYILIGNILIATYLSHILVYLSGFLALCLLKRLTKISWAKTIFLYLFVFANPIAVGNFIKLGRLPELLSFVLFIILFSFFVYYNGRRLNGKFLLLGVLYAAVLLSHPAFFIASSFFIPPIFFMKKGKQRVVVILMFLITLLLSSFWLVPFINASAKSTLSQEAGYTGLNRLLDLRKEFFFDNLFSFILPLFFWFTFYFYCKSLEKKERRKEIVFYSIPLIFSILFFFRIAAFIPLVNYPYPDSYNLLLIFLSMFLFIQTPKKGFGKIWKIIPSLLILTPFLLIIPSLIFVPNFRQHNAIDKDILQIIPKIEGRFLVLGMPYPTYDEAVYSYAAVYYNLSTPNGWYPQTAPKSLLLSIGRLKDEVKSNQPNCEKINSSISELGIQDLIIYRNYCGKLRSCGLKQMAAEGSVCLLSS